MMNALDPLLAAVGKWHGVNRLWLSQEEPPAESVSEMNVVALLGNRFVRIDQSWAYGNDAQSGSLLLGFDPKNTATSVYWIDTFHMGRKVLACVGAAPVGGVVDVLGKYSAPPGPDWGWRITIEAKPSNELLMVMYNIDPDGKQELAVQATHTRAASAGVK